PSPAISGVRSGTATPWPRARSTGTRLFHVDGPTSGLCSSVMFTAARRLRVHAVEEVRVVLGRAQLLEQELDRVGRAHRRQDAAQDVRLGERALVEQQL